MILSQLLLKLILLLFLVTVGSSDDDMVEFLKSLGLEGAVGFLELSITGVPFIHIVAAGIHHSSSVNPSIYSLLF